MLEEQRRDKPNSRGEEKIDVELFSFSLSFFVLFFLFLENASTIFVTNCTLAEPFLGEVLNCFMLFEILSETFGVLDSSILGHQQGGNS